LLEAAARLGELALDADDLEGATQATRAGLLLIPASDSMRRLQMRAAAAASDGQRLEAVYKAGCWENSRVGPWAELDDQTVALLRS